MTGGAAEDFNVEDEAAVCVGGAALAEAGAGGSGVAHASLLPHASMLLIPEKLEDWTAAGLAAGAGAGAG